MEKVSVIIPAFNVEKYIHRAIDSVLRQTYSNVELIVIDDGSTDKTYEIIEAYAKKISTMNVVRQANKGVSTARNVALDRMTGSYCVFLDSDDWLEDHAIETLMNMQKDHPNYLISCDRFFAYFDKQGLIYKERQRAPAGLDIIDRNEAISNMGTWKFNLQSSCYKLFDRNLIDGLRFNSRISHGEDGLFVFEYLKKCQGMVFSTEPLWNILERPGSATTSPYNKKWLTAVEAASIIKEYGEVEPELSIPLGLYYIERIEMVENAAVCGEPLDRENIDYLRDKLRSNSQLLRGADCKQKLKYVVYAYAPLWLLKRLVLCVRRLKA